MTIHPKKSHHCYEVADDKGNYPHVKRSQGASHTLLD